MSTNFQHLQGHLHELLRHSNIAEIWQRIGTPSLAYSNPNPPSTSGQGSREAAFPPPPTSKSEPPTRQRKGPSMRTLVIGFIVILIILLIFTTLGALFLTPHKNTSTNTASPVPVVGRISFISSGQLYVNNDQGISDEVLIDLHNIPAPAPGKSYYAWLLGDANQTDVAWDLLGQLSVNGGNIHFLYPGDVAHTNLLNDLSRFLITEEDANTTPTNPLLDQSTWRYFAQIYQLPSPKDPNHFSLLDHLRHLLVQAPELKSLGLSGGLSIWLMRNVQEISKWSLSAKEQWENKNASFIRQALVNILYYLDGECTSSDLQGLPPGTPTTPENATIAHIAHFALLNPCIQEEQEQAELLKQVFQHTPHNYIDHLLFHMAGVLLSPDATQNQRAVALQLNTAINNVRNWLGQVHLDALQLLHMSDGQLTQVSGFAILGDLETQARYAFAGHTDPNTGNMQQGATWIFDNTQRLATLDVTPYPSKSNSQ